MTQSVPGAIATGSQLTRRSSLPKPITRSLSLPVPTSTPLRDNRQAMLNSFALKNHVTRAGAGGHDGEYILLSCNHDLDHRDSLMREAGCKHGGQFVGLCCAHSKRPVRFR